MVKNAPVAQQIEQPRPKGLVGGAIPSRGTKKKINEELIFRSFD